MNTVEQIEFLRKRIKEQDDYIDGISKQVPVGHNPTERQWELIESAQTVRDRFREDLIRLNNISIRS